MAKSCRSTQVLFADHCSPGKPWQYPDRLKSLVLPEIPVGPSQTVSHHRFAWPGTQWPFDNDASGIHQPLLLQVYRKYVLRFLLPPRSACPGPYQSNLPLHCKDHLNTFLSVDQGLSSCPGIQMHIEQISCEPHICKRH